MDPHEKKRLRHRVGEHLDVSGARLTDDEATFLDNFVDEYDETYKGRTETRTTSHDGWSSDGKYTRQATFTDTFTDDVGIRQDYKYQDDDGQSGGVVERDQGCPRDPELVHRSLLTGRADAR